ncbi:probable E3 ubiquitin-protein ligase HERC3 isoform X2 [Brienomyrus brachyistius]|uniref:probable E3 ubiquitin-protein ligase HERC3 isoform X2 n=1 Tax=Brienomyrus brachyistius TaxID=42636 RepID=UPI0020B4194F|nr:probable E3 ubiquitin-protein ligase HERC3 isoform X2 [Brienomyrus brachyistius]
MYSWGESALGDAGQTDGLDLDYELLSERDILSVGREITAFLQRNEESTFYLREIKTQETKSFHLKGKIHTLHCGACHVVVVTAKGKVYQLDCGQPKSNPRYLHLNKVVQVACGDNHSVLLRQDGQIFTWGCNSSGQLGLGNREPSKMPQSLLGLAGIPLAQIAAGGDHSLALSVSGAVFSWGSNRRGQLGLGDVTDRDRPVPVRSLHGKKTIYISCGGEHTATLTQGGLVFTFGSGEFGQLGHNSDRDELHPRLVAELWGAPVTQIACGRYHTLTYVTSLKTIYAFGHGQQGQLGNGLTTDQNIPLPVHLPTEHRECGLRRILAGENQCFALWCPAQGPENCSTLEGIPTIDDKTVNNWLSRCDSESRKTKKEITQLFSSASCINGSFLRQGHDRFCRTRPKTSSLDLSLARQTFEKLGRNEEVLMQVLSVVLKNLLPSLSTVAADVEGLRVYLILPELIRVLRTQQNIRDLSLAFAEAVLPHVDMAVLWSELPFNFFKDLVKIFRSVLSAFLHEMRTECTGDSDWKLKLENIAILLHRLSEVNLRSGRKIDESNFYISEIKLYFRDLQEQSLRNKVLFMKILNLLSQYPAFFDMESKCVIFKINFWINFFEREASENPFEQNSLYVNRKSLLADTLHHLRNVSRNFCLPLQVKFHEEDGVDHGGVSQEFFSILGREFHSMRPHMFEFFEDSRLVWFTSEVQCDPDLFLWLGVLCGMALYNFCIINFHFPLVLFKKLLSHKPTLKDLEDLSPVEARSLNEVLKEEEDFVDQLDLDFTAKGHELVPNGREKLVTKFNRCEYVDAYVNYVFNVSVKQQFSAFAEGFSRGCPNEKWKMFVPEELLAVFTGNVNYEWEELRKNATYKGYSADHENIQRFWSVFAELSEQQKKNFLSFMTGSDRLPVGGLSKVCLEIVKYNKEGPDDYYPVANTCYRVLHLPNYSNMETLREKLLHAIQFYEEFGER